MHPDTALKRIGGIIAVRHAFRIHGPPTLEADARFATWLLDSLTGFVQTELARHLMGHLAPRGDRRFVINGFVGGCTARIGERIRELCSRSETVVTGNGRELVVTKKHAIAAVMAKAGIRLRAGSRSSRRLDPDAYAAGKAAGERASFGRPLEGKAAALRLR